MSFLDAQFLSFTVIVVGAISLVALERLYPYNRGQKLFRQGFWDDFVWYNFVQSYILGVLISGFLLWVDGSTGFSRAEVVTHWPIWAQVLFFLVLHDLYIYTFHRMQHGSKFLWRTHEAHHSVQNVDWLSGVRSHPIEILINQTIEFAPIILLGAAPEVAAIKGAISATWGMYIHSNIDVRMGILQRVFNGPEMHRWHHESRPEAYNKNFATKFAIWDWLFGTAFLPDPKVRKAQFYGLGEEAEIYPEGYFRQVWAAFRPFPKSTPPSSDPASPEEKLCIGSS